MRIQQQKNLEDFISSRRSSLSSLQTPTISPLTPPSPFPSSFDPYHQLPLIANRQPPVVPIPIIPTSTTSPTTVIPTSICKGNAYFKGNVNCVDGICTKTRDL